MKSAATLYVWEEEVHSTGGREEGEELLRCRESDNVTECLCERDGRDV